MSPRAQLDFPRLVMYAGIAPSPPLAHLSSQTVFHNGAHARTDFSPPVCYISQRAWVVYLHSVLAGAPVIIGSLLLSKDRQLQFFGGFFCLESTYINWVLDSTGNLIGPVGV